MSSRGALLWGLLAGSLGLSAGAKDAAGQAEPKKPAVLPPVEVVATRRPEAPHDVPASIEVIAGDDLRARGATSLRDALALAAGIAIAPGGDGGPASAVPEFWGLREFDAFLLVVDGVPWGGGLNPALATLNLRDVLRIEILRGPAAVTFGATSFIGVIHVVHNVAAATSRTLAVRGGSFGTGGLSTDFAVPSSGPWKSRASVDFERQGFKDDRTDYKRGHALWRTAKTDGDRSTWITGDLNFLRQDPASPHPREGPALSRAVPLDANHNPAGAFLNENRFTVSGGWQRPVMQGSLWGTTASFTHSSQNMFRGFLTDISNGPNNASGFKEDIEVTDLYLDTHILWPSQSRLRFMTGADALLANGEATGATFHYTAPLNGATATAVPEPTTLDQDAATGRLFLGAYGSAEWRPTRRVTFTGGLRLNLTSERRGEESAPSVSHSRLSGSLGALFGLWEQDANHLRVFATFRSTFKPAAFDFSLAENEGILDPETSKSYEGGLKLRAVDGRVDVEASVFQMDFNNLVTATVVNNLPALINSGKTRFKGFELASDVRLPHAMFARASYSFHDGKFVDFVEAFDGVPTELGGKRFEMSARHLLSAGLSLWPATGFIANVNVNYTGDRYLNKRNTALAPSFATVDAGIGYRTRTAEFRLDGRNLSNRRDAVSESEVGDAQYYRMTARTIQAGIVVSY